MTSLAEMKGCNGISMPFGMYRLISIDDADWKEVITRVNITISTRIAGIWTKLGKPQQKRKPNYHPQSYFGTW